MTWLNWVYSMILCSISVTIDSFFAYFMHFKAHLKSRYIFLATIYYLGITVTIIIKSSMSLDASKIMQVYESCLTLLKAKKSLYVDNHELNALFSRPELNSKEKKNLSVEYIEDGLLKLLRVWSKKFNAY